MSDFPSTHSVPVEPLPAIWRVDDALWTRIESIIGEVDPPAPTGRPRAEARPIFDAIIYRGRSGLQWNQLPAAFPNGDPFPDDSTVHRTMQRWIALGLLERIWAVLIEECEELGAVSFEWQSVDTALGKLAAAVMKSGETPQIAEKVA
jgi:putative transposase